MIASPRPHYLLFAEANYQSAEAAAWRFALEDVTTGHGFAATDAEPADCHERLELLAVVRGLEAIDQPAKVTLVTKSRYVSRGLKRGLAEWRAKGWKWERFGRVVAVRDHDLWRRVDRALSFHQIECRLWQFEESPEPPAAAPQKPAKTARAGLAAAAKAKLRRAAASLGEAFQPAGLATS